VLIHGTVGANPEWKEQYQNWVYKVTGRDYDDEPLAIVVALEPQLGRITKSLAKTLSDMPKAAASKRRCTECGAIQTVVRKTVCYPQSGLDNVELANVPVWVCADGHEEVEIPAVTELHELLAQMIIRKPAFLDGAEIKFLRRRVELSAKEFADRIGITPQHLSRLENDKGKSKILDLLIRLSIASLIAARDRKPFPADLAPFVDQLETAWDIGAHRLRHNDQAPAHREWEEAIA